MAGIRTLVVAGSTLNAELLRKGLTREPELDVVQTVDTLDSVVEHARTCDVIVLHADFPPTDIVNIVQHLRSKVPDVRVVISRVPDVPQEIVPYLEAGAKGYVREGDSLSHLVRVIRTVHEGAALVDPEVARHLIEHFTAISRRLNAEVPGFDPAGSPEYNLTERQTEVLKLITRGMSNQEIAEALYIEVGTVKNHVHNILKALGVDDREQAARWFQRFGDGGMRGDEAPEPTSHSESANPEPHIPSELQEVIVDLAQRFGWPVGHIWVSDLRSEALRPSQIWAVDDPELRAPFIEVTEGHMLAKHDGIIGHIHATGEPLVLTNLTTEEGFYRSEAARRAGLKAGLFIPLVGEGQIIGILEFFSSEARVPEPEVVIEGATDLSWRLLEIRRQPDSSPQ